MLYYFVIVIALLGLGYGLLYFWQGKITTELSEGAGFEYDLLQKNDPGILADVDERRFREIYTRVNFPRFPRYVLGALAGFALGTPIALGLLSGGASLIDHFTEKPTAEVFADTYVINDDNSITAYDGNQTDDLWYYILQDFSGFYYFFGLLGFWIAIFAFAMRLYYRNVPSSLRDEILRQR